MIEFGGLALAMVGIGLAFWFGRASGRNALFYAMEFDTQFRRELLERLARWEGARVVGRE